MLDLHVASCSENNRFLVFLQHKNVATRAPNPKSLQLATWNTPRCGPLAAARPVAANPNQIRTSPKKGVGLCTDGIAAEYAADFLTGPLVWGKRHRPCPSWSATPDCGPELGLSDFGLREWLATFSVWQKH